MRFMRRLLQAVVLATHESRRAWPDLSHEGIDDTFVSMRNLSFNCLGKGRDDPMLRR